MQFSYIDWIWRSLHKILREVLNIGMFTFHSYIFNDSNILWAPWLKNLSMHLNVSTLLSFSGLKELSRNYLVWKFSILFKNANYQIIPVHIWNYWKNLYLVYKNTTDYTYNFYKQSFPYPVKQTTMYIRFAYTKKAKQDNNNNDNFSIYFISF